MSRPQNGGSLLWRAMTSAPRLALQYILLFGASGVTLPFAGPWFRSPGLSGAQIGVPFALPLLARALTGPVVAGRAGGFRRRRPPIGLLGPAGAGGYRGG